MNFIKLFVAIGLICSLFYGRDGWKGIVPLRSTRADVELLLGTPASSCRDLCTYETKNEIVIARYSGEPCDEKKGNRWQVPPDTVIELTVNLAEAPKLADLRVNLKKFKKTIDPELHGYHNYSNQDMGLSYSVSDHGRVFSIDYFVNRKNDNALRCSVVN
jgi:hypothetical protein